MATSITTTYAGEFAGKYISAALLSADTIEGGGITVKPNVKYKEVMKTLSTNALVKDAACDFADQSTVTLAEKVLTPEEFQVNLELCKKDFHSDWEAVQMGYSAYDSLPPSFADFLIGHIAAKVAQKTEENIWQGATATAGEFDGFTALLAADGDVIDVVGTTVTAANVIDELGKVVDAIPTSVYGKEDLYIYVSQSIARAYVRALGGFGASGLGANGVNNAGTTWYNGGDLAFDGVKLFVCSGMPDNDMVAAQKSNLFFGTGLLSDHNEVKLIDMADLDGSQNVRVVMRFTAGVQIGIGADIVYYT
ncbi:hypothetical protein N9Z17_04260 [Planktomarina temperata]|jgi:hypothetical protein|nr:hypothetical protein [Planktomarina temperata]